MFRIFVFLYFCIFCIFCIFCTFFLYFSIGVSLSALLVERLPAVCLPLKKKILRRMGKKKLNFYVRIKYSGEHVVSA